MHHHHQLPACDTYSPHPTSMRPPPPPPPPQPSHPPHPSIPTLHTHIHTLPPPHPHPFHYHSTCYHNNNNNNNNNNSIIHNNIHPPPANVNNINMTTFPNANQQLPLTSLTSSVSSSSTTSSSCSSATHFFPYTVNNHNLKQHYIPSTSNVTIDPTPPIIISSNNNNNNNSNINMQSNKSTTTTTITSPDDSSCSSQLPPPPPPPPQQQQQQQLLQYEEKEQQQLIDSITSILQATCEANNTTLNVGTFASSNGYRSKSFPDGSSSLFFSLRKPAILLKPYISRLIKFVKVSKSTFIIALIYLDKVHNADTALALTDLNVHRLITTALVLAVKFIEDEPMRNSTMAKIGGIPSTQEMNLLEIQMLRRLCWNCSIDSHVYKMYEKCVIGNIKKNSNHINNSSSASASASSSSSSLSNDIDLSNLNTHSQPQLQPQQQQQHHPNSQHHHQRHHQQYEIFAQQQQQQHVNHHEISVNRTAPDTCLDGTVYHSKNMTTAQAADSGHYAIQHHQHEYNSLVQQQQQHRYHQHQKSNIGVIADKVTVMR